MTKLRYFAEIDDNDVVVALLCVEESKCQDENGNFNEKLGVDHLCEVYKNGTFVETRVDGVFRRRKAEINGSYLRDNDIFISEQPYPSWLLDLDNAKDWVAPVERPFKVGYWYEWDEENLAWISQEMSTEFNFQIADVLIVGEE